MSEEIKKIAREYAENVKSEYVSAKLIETLVMGFYHSRLKTDFCIVPKELAVSTYNDYYNKWKVNQNEYTEAQCCIARELLETLFGTELFNEEKE